LGPWLAARLSALGPLALPLGLTLGAQVGVVLPSVLVFGRLPLVSVVANLLAVPVAGFVMLYGLPAGLVAGSVPPLAPLLMLPARVGTRWVDTVAMLGARFEPDPPWVWVGWGGLAVVVLAIVVRAPAAPSATPPGATTSFVAGGTRPGKNRGRHGDPPPQRQ
jgi:competence protein ComEC